MTFVCCSDQPDFSTALHEICPLAFKFLLCFWTDDGIFLWLKQLNWLLIYRKNNNTEEISRMTPSLLYHYILRHLTPPTNQWWSPLHPHLLSECSVLATTCRHACTGLFWSTRSAQLYHLVVEFYIWLLWLRKNAFCSKTAEVLTRFLFCRVQFRQVLSKFRQATTHLTWRRSGVVCTLPYWRESASSGQSLRGKPAAIYHHVHCCHSKL